MESSNDTPLDVAIRDFLAWHALPIPETCPKCGQTPVTKMVYGLIRHISPALQADLVAGKAQLGGCMEGRRSPKWYCKACGHQEVRPTHN